MAVSLASELYAALCAALLGFGLALLWDAFSVVRILFGLYDTPHLPARLLSFHFPLLRAGSLSNQTEKRGLLASAALFLLDFSYALAAGVAFLLFLYAFHDGVFRLFLLVAATLSFALYRLSLGRLVFFALGTVAFLLRVFVAYLSLVVRLPLAIVINMIFFAARAILSFALLFVGRLLAPLATRLSLARALRESGRFLSACIKSSA